MWYMIVGEDYPDSLEKRSATREKHLTRLKILAEQKRVLIAGPLLLLFFEIV